MHDFWRLRLLKRHWEASKPAMAPGDPRSAPLQKRVDEGLAELEALAVQIREQDAAALWILRRLSKTLGIKAARPLPRLPTSRAFPATGGDYGIRYFAGAAGPCVACGAEAGDGPLAWRRSSDPGPICDGCLSGLDPRLVSIPMLVGILREAGAIALEKPQGQADLGLLLLAMVHVFEARDFEGLPIRPIASTSHLEALLTGLRLANQPAPTKTTS